MKSLIKVIFYFLFSVLQTHLFQVKWQIDILTFSDSLIFIWTSLYVLIFIHFSLQVLIYITLHCTVLAESRSTRFPYITEVPQNRAAFIPCKSDSRMFNGPLRFAEFEPTSRFWTIRVTDAPGFEKGRLLLKQGVPRLYLSKKQNVIEELVT